MSGEDMTLTLPVPKDHDWVPNWPVTPERLRVVDPETLLIYGDAGESCWQSARARLRDQNTLLSVDRNARPLIEALERWNLDGFVNAANPGDLTLAALQGSAIAASALTSTPQRPGFTHPAWHIVLTILEDTALGESGLAGVMALNAAYFGSLDSSPWPGHLTRPVPKP